MAASSDSSRRRPRKSAIPKTKTPVPKGFPSKSQAGTSTQKKDKRDIEEKVIGEIGETEVDLQSSIPSNTVKRRVEILEKLEENDDGNNTLSSGITSTAFSNDESDSQLVEYKDVEGKKGLKHKELMGVQQSWGDTIR